jgi:hypothetical protein
MNKDTLGKIIAITAGIVLFGGSAAIATIVTGQSPIDALAWLIWVTGGLALVAFAIVVAAAILLILALQKEE